MLSKKRLLPTYPDGWAFVYRDKPFEHDFSEEARQKRNPNDPANMEYVDKLAFADEYVRAQDYEFAEQRGFSVSRKIRTHNHKAVKTDCKVIIEEQVFGIKHLDRDGNEMYLYLEGVSEVAE